MIDKPPLGTFYSPISEMLKDKDKCKWQFIRHAGSMGSAKIKISCNKNPSYYSTRGLGYKFCPYCGKVIEHE